LCKLRCADALDLFYYEFNRTATPSVTEPFAYSVSAESPFFNPYASPGSGNTNSLHFMDQRLIALGTRNQTLHPGCRPCLAGCLATVKTPWTATAPTFTMRTYCIPPADALQATVYASGIEQDWVFEPPESVVGTLTYCDFALQPHDTLYVLLGYSDMSMSITQEGLFTKGALKATSTQRLYAVWHDATDVLQQPQQAVHHLLLDTTRLAQVLLTPTVQSAVLGNTATGARVTTCSIQSLVELATGIRGQLLFFFSVTFTIQQQGRGNTAAATAESSDTSTTTTTTTTGYVHGILLWTDPVLLSSSSVVEEHQFAFYPPCPTCVGMPPCDNPKPAEGCRPGLDTVLYLAKHGTFLHIENDLYLHVPSSGTSTTTSSSMLLLPLQFVQIDPTGVATVHPVVPPATLFSSATYYAGSIPLLPNNNVAGGWTRADVFALSGLSARVIRSPVLHFPRTTLRWLQGTQLLTSTASTASQSWFAEVRLVRTSKGLTLQTFASQNVSATAKLKTACSPYSCQACTSSTLRLLCTSVQDCMLSRCVGTLVNSKNVLCSVGIMTEQLYLQMVASWRATYLILMEMVMFAVKGFGGNLPQNVVLVFPTDQFYTLVCTCKDVYAGAVGMAMAVVESMRGLMQTGMLSSLCCCLLVVVVLLLLSYCCCLLVVVLLSLSYCCCLIVVVLFLLLSYCCCLLVVVLLLLSSCCCLLVVVFLLLLSYCCLIVVSAVVY